MHPVTAIWDFPKNNGGIAYGLTDAATTYFQADRLRHVVRELIQNSLDAHDTGFPSVEVEISEITIPRSSFGGDELAAHFRACLEEVERAENTNARRDATILKRGMRVLRRKNIPCLRIVDAGTRGLRPRNWRALVESEGIVHKEGPVSGGSFGIGKNAAFTVSDLLAVVYATRYSDGRRGRVEKCQGKARLMTHPDPKLPREADDLGPSDYLQNTGFYRAPDLSPLVGKEDIPEEFRLHDTAGTGLWILGFNPHSDNWVVDVQRAVCENFFMAIHNRWLTVKITAGKTREVVVNHETVDAALDTSAASSPSLHFYRAIRQDEPHSSTLAVKPIGKLDVYFIAGAGPSRTAYVNRKGMLITDSTDQSVNPFSPRRRVTWTDFTVVVTPQSDAGDLWVRSMESPAHDAIQPVQLSEPMDQEQAKRVFENIRRKLRNIIDAEMETHSVDLTENLNELAAYLPEDSNGCQTERQLSLTRIQTRFSDTPVLDDEQVDDGHSPGRGQSSGSSGDNGHVEGQGGDLEGRRKRSIPPLPIRNPRVLPLGPNQIMVNFALNSETDQAVSLTIHPRGYEPTAERALNITAVELLSADNGVRPVAHTDRIQLFPGSTSRVSLLVETEGPIDDISAFDIHVRSVQ